MFLSPSDNPLNQFMSGVIPIAPQGQQGIVRRHNLRNLPSIGNQSMVMDSQGRMIRIVSIPSLGLQIWYYPDGSSISYPL